MKIKIIWTRKLGHLYQSLAVSSRGKSKYGYGVTRKEASEKARQALLHQTIKGELAA